MATKEKVKMCPFCEGTIPVEATECRYCGSSLMKGKERKAPCQSDDSLAGLYGPPYSPGKTKVTMGIPTPYDEDDYEEKEEEEKKEEGSEKTKEESKQIGALLLLSIGAHLFTLAWLLFFFSDHGRLVLEWKSRYWFIYLLFALPLIYQGWKKLSRE